MVSLQEKPESPAHVVCPDIPAALSLIEPIIMIIMGIFVAFVLISLYLPIFSLADSIRN